MKAREVRVEEQLYGFCALGDGWRWVFKKRQGRFTS